MLCKHIQHSSVQHHSLGKLVQLYSRLGLLHAVVVRFRFEDGSVHIVHAISVIQPDSLAFDVGESRCEQLLSPYKSVLGGIPRPGESVVQFVILATSVRYAVS